MFFLGSGVQERESTNTIKDYPKPMVLHKQAAATAIEFFKHNNKKGDLQ
jgi:hypothetical protein